MYRLILSNILLGLMALTISSGMWGGSPALARTAECDQCGYCKRATQQVPDNWSACAQCIYGVPSTARADENRTLQINLDPNDPNYNKPPQPLPGKYYTQLGCIDTGLNSFRDPSAAGGVLNFFLTYLIFPTVGTLALGTIVYGAFLLLTAQGDVMQIAQGKRLITSAMVGLIFTISAVLIVNLIGRDILRIPGMGGSRVENDLTRIRDAMEKLETDTGRLPNNLDPATCTHNPEVYFNSPAAGIIDTNGSFSNWNGPYLTLAQVTDPNGRYYRFDPDYYCRPDVEGCKNVLYSGTSDGISQMKKVRAIVYSGPDGDPEYCLNGIAQCPDPTIRPDLDNVVLVLCE